MEGFVLVTSHWARVFFFVYYVVGVLVVLNLSIAFVLDAFITEQKKYYRHAKLKSGLSIDTEALDVATFNAQLVPESTLVRQMHMHMHSNEWRSLYDSRATM